MASTSGTATESQEKIPYVTLPPGANLLEYLSRPYNCSAPKCPHRYLTRSDLSKHERDAHPRLRQPSAEAHSDYFSDEDPIGSSGAASSHADSSS
ncbi:hypothetical protein CC80DRAFT_497179 [Byssothecium circinans]|uniref:C2H2-type domain-containing protein n=1 Tax=Byssothecium circinans TaxID=147558 RepID=A0A6A5TDT6_9PLEO|nr:hypothetical protein CC80DRAFT_497179 [Byssothecium circinans]